MMAIAQIKPEEKSDKPLPGAPAPKSPTPPLKSSPPPLKTPSKPLPGFSAPPTPSGFPKLNGPMGASNELDDDSGEEAIKNLIKGMNMDDQDVNDVVDIHDDPIADMHIIAQQMPMPPNLPAPEENLDEVSLPPEVDMDPQMEDPMIDGAELPPEISADEPLDNALQNVTMEN